MPDEELVNALAQYLDLEVVEKQALLERDGLVERCRSLIELLEMKVITAPHHWGGEDRWSLIVRGFDPRDSPARRVADRRSGIIEIPSRVRCSRLANSSHALHRRRAIFDPHVADHGHGSAGRRGFAAGGGGRVEHLTQNAHLVDGRRESRW